MTNIAMEAMALIEIDGLPIKNSGSFHGYVSPALGLPGNHGDPGVQDGSAGSAGETLRNSSTPPLQWSYVMICHISWKYGL